MKQGFAAPGDDPGPPMSHEWNGVLLFAELLIFLLVLAWAFIVAAVVSVATHQTPGSQTLSIVCFLAIPGAWLGLTIFAHRSFKRSGRKRPIAALLLAPIGFTIATALILSIWAHSLPNYLLCESGQAAAAPAFCADP